VQADLILYNTCSIRDKAEQKVFHRLADYKKLLSTGQEVWRAGLRGAAGRRKDFRARAACVDGVRIGLLPQSAADADPNRNEAGKQRVTGLDDRETDECFETEFTARTNPHRGYITIIEGCDKFCAYCVVPFTRGKERSRTSESVLAEARQMADLGYTEIQLLGQNVNSL
jgi:tRNA-2-methylthio-N6-dimethylallyladenosine synthase